MYRTSIVCDQCANSAEVPSPGAAPVGWVLVRVLHEGDETPTTYTICDSPMCFTSLGRLFLIRKETEPAENARTPKKSR